MCLRRRNLGEDAVPAAEVINKEQGCPAARDVSALEAPNRVTTTFYTDPATERAFTWYSTVEQAPAALVSTDPSFPEEATVEVHAVGEITAGGESLFRAIATGLQPGAIYHYRVGDAKESVWSAVGTFETAGGGDDFTFLVLTDTDAGDLGEARIAAETIDKALRYVPEAKFLVHGGGFVARDARERQWQDLLDEARSGLFSTTLTPVAGSGDAAAGAFENHFTLAGPAKQDTSTGVYYSYTYGRAHFMVLNTNEGGAEGISAEQLAWLRSDAVAAREAGARWLVMAMHKGVYTTGKHLDDEDVIVMRRKLVPVISELGIDLVLQGQDHIMSRTSPLVAAPDLPEGARAAQGITITEMRNGKRVDYSVGPEGTYYFLPNTAGARHTDQATRAEGMEIETYLRLFDRTGRQDTQNFAAVTITQDRLTVESYDIRERGVPRLFEGFGIDRGPLRVNGLIESLPHAHLVTLRHMEQVRAVRAEVDALSKGGRTALTELSRLEATERRLRELCGLVLTEGEEVPWADTEAVSRQLVTIRNHTSSAFEDTPVRFRMPETPEAALEAVAFFTSDGVPMPYEIETLQPGGISTVWVKVPRLEATANTVSWVYFGGEGHSEDPPAVWGQDYALVEHFSPRAPDAEQRIDSTGRNTGDVIGESLKLEVSARGTGEAHLGGTRLEYPGNVGGDFDRISVSGICSLTEEELTMIGDLAPVIAKEDATGAGQAAFHQGVRGSDGKVETRLAGNSFEFDDVDLRHLHSMPADGEPHLVTQTYDGMTYTVFVDGKQVHAEFLEYRTTFSDPSVPTTIGDFATGDSTLAAPFPGTAEEVQIAGIAFTPDFEAFRYAMLLGDAISYGPPAERGTEEAMKGPEDVTVAATSRGENPECGEVDFFVRPSVELDESSVTVRTGTTPARLPERLKPDSGTVSQELFPTTVGQGENPFQIYEIALSEEQAAQEEFCFVWSGRGDHRQVSGYLYDHAVGTWLLKDTGADPYRGGRITLKLRVRADERAVDGNGVVHVLVWRGLTELPVGEGYDYEAMPDPALYDWAFDQVGDTQLYAQATPEIMNHQFEHIAGVAEERRTSMVVHAGDWVNRPYLSQEYQWLETMTSAELLEESNIPYMISWGNHDYAPAGERNDRLMLQRHFTMSRFERSLQGTPWEFGGSHDIDNYYYKADISGARLLFLTVGFYSADKPTRPGLAWARQIIESHPDHTVVLATHSIVGKGVGAWTNQHTLDALVDPHDNVRLVLGGHITGTGVAWRQTEHPHGAWGILTDHQGRIYGGEGYYKHISVDMENKLMYVNTYSAWLDSSASDGQWHHDVPPGAVPGLYGSDTENFVLEIDLGGMTTRTLATESFSFAL